MLAQHSRKWPKGTMGLMRALPQRKKMTNGHEMQSDTGVAKKEEVWIKKVGISTRPELSSNNGFYSRQYLVYQNVELSMVIQKINKDLGFGFV